VNPIPGAPTVDLSAEPHTLVSGQLPQCSTLSWNAPLGSTVLISSQWAGTIASGLGPSGYMPVCPDNTTMYTAKATNAGGNNDCTAVVTVLPPVIQTSCTQIVKIPTDTTQPESCLNVCFELGGEKRMVSADLYDNRFCQPNADGSNVKQLPIFGPKETDAKLRVKSLNCSPCGITSSAGLKSMECSGNTDTTLFPFDILGLVNGEGTPYQVRCSEIFNIIEPVGFTIDLGNDPCYSTPTGSSCYACPAGWRDTGVKCVKP
jgi:hypothetical protein